MNPSSHLRRGLRPVSAAFSAALLLAASVFAQSGANYAIQLTAQLHDDPLLLVLTWPEDGAEDYDYVIHRRKPGAATWGEPIGGKEHVARLEDGRRSFTDALVEPGVAYEYSVARKFIHDHGAGVSHTAHGYILAGTRVPLVEHRGIVVLVVEHALVDPLAAELARLQNDLVGDGWRVVRHEVSRDERVGDVKARIKQTYDAEPEAVRALFLLGRVPVPYSGNFQPTPPDGHTAPGDDHRGAWPADVFYADLDGKWTDETESYTNHNSTRATNHPGDGKFDQSYLPSDVELQMGRVDLSAMPGAQAAKPLPGEIELLKFYLDKNHLFRHGRTPVRRHALIADSRDPAGGRAYSASGYRSFAPMFGPAHVTIVSTEPDTPREERWLAKLRADSFLWAYGNGAGSNTSASGLGARGASSDLWAADLLDEPAHGVFHFLFGSWFGDWDQPDNLMRTTLLTKFGLACAWSGRPHHVFHAMALGETLGGCMRATQNNEQTYHNQINTFRRGIHIALIGDPTLRLHPVPAPAELQAVFRGNDVALTWKPSPMTVLGYHVYRAPNRSGKFERLTDSLVTEPQFVHGGGGAGAGEAVYMVRAVVLETTPSGSYFNASQGIFATPAP